MEKNGVVTDIEFQSPIGTNKTVVNACEFVRGTLFQSPIGTNKTWWERRLLCGKRVSIPYRYKQNK